LSKAERSSSLCGETLDPEALYWSCQTVCRDNRYRANNILKSSHAALRHRIQVSHPNLFIFLGHLQHVTTECMHDMARLTNGLNIRRPKLKMNLMNERDARQSMRFTIRFRILQHKTVAPTRRETHSLMLCSRVTTRPSSTKMTSTSSQRPQHHLLQRLQRLPHHRRHRHLQITWRRTCPLRPRVVLC